MISMQHLGHDFTQVDEIYQQHLQALVSQANRLRQHLVDIARRAKKVVSSMLRAGLSVCLCVCLCVRACVCVCLHVCVHVLSISQSTVLLSGQSNGTSSSGERQGECCFLMSAPTSIPSKVCTLWTH